MFFCLERVCLLSNRIHCSFSAAVFTKYFSLCFVGIEYMSLDGSCKKGIFRWTAVFFKFYLFFFQFISINLLLKPNYYYFYYYYYYLLPNYYQTETRCIFCFNQTRTILCLSWSPIRLALCLSNIFIFTNIYIVFRNHF